MFTLVTDPAQPIEQQAEALLDSLEMSRMKLGTERMQAMATALGSPQNSYPVVHVAGTNGKGSVVAMLTSIAKAQGLKVGSTTSPHLQHPRERILLQGEPLPLSDFAQAVFELKGKLEAAFPNETEPPTYFEFLTLLAFYVFQQHQVDLAVVEVGLGGRLDATNILHRPACTAITSIGWDHVHLLGPTLVDIAREKGGIIQEGVPLILGPNLPDEARQTLLSIAEERYAAPVMEVNADPLFAEPWQVGSNCQAGRRVRNLVSGQKYTLSLLGSYQRNNLAVVLGCVDVLRRQGIPLSQEAIEKGLATTQWAGRFQWFPNHSIFLDGSHNADGFQSLTHSLDEVLSKAWGLYLMLSLRENRDPALLVRFIERLNTPVLGIVCTQAASKPGTFHNASSLRRYLRKQLPQLQSRPIWAATNISGGLWMLKGWISGHRPPQDANPPQAFGLITGSLYTVGEALPLLSPASA